MIRFRPFLAVTTGILLSLSSGHLLAHEYHEHENAFSLPEGETLFGDGHGEIAVAKNGDVYVSVQGGKFPGLQVYSKEGKYLRNVPSAPKDLHGFILHEEDGNEYIYGARMVGQSVVKMTLEGKVILEIPMTSFPQEYRNLKGKNGRQLKLTAVAVSPNGDIYAVDGYGLDYIHQFDKSGKHLKTFGGRKAPYDFSNLHKIAIDPRFEPVRILGTNRSKGTLVHLSLTGEYLGVHAKDLRRPSAVDFRGENVVLAEIAGRITILNKEGKIIDTVSDNPAKYKGNRWTPEEWKTGIVGSPHGIAYDQEGNILMTEYNKFGRVMKFTKKDK